MRLVLINTVKMKARMTNQVEGQVVGSLDGTIALLESRYDSDEDVGCAGCVNFFRVTEEDCAPYFWCHLFSEELTEKTDLGIKAQECLLKGKYIPRQTQGGGQ